MPSNIYSSNQPPKSAIINKGFSNRLNSLYGFETTNKPVTQIEKRTGLKFVKVDLNNPNYRFKNALLGNIVGDTKLSSNLEKYFDSWLTETTLGYEDIAERQQRLNELYFMYCNDAFISRTCHLVADEATNPDTQNRLISIESPNLAFVQETYKLLNQWGVTQQRVNGTCFDIQLYGEAFWDMKVGLDGIESMKPLDPTVIQERLEFNPMKVADFLARRDGGFLKSFNKSEKVKKLVTMLTDDSINTAEEASDIFDTKLFGYELENDLFVPPWTILHFRYNADRSEFYPYGRPPLITCLAPFKLTLSTRTLQGLARAMSFPVTLYKVKSKEQLTNAANFNLVEDVKEQYDSVPVNPLIATNEVYTLNTKIWYPDELLDVDVKESKVDIDFTGDLEMYQDQVVVAAGVPKGYLVQEWGGFGNSALSLTEQFKPFARHIYSVQSTFLSELGNAIRLHYAITGKFDYNTPFTMSMRFPAEEMSEDKRNARTSSLELSQKVIEILTQVVGLEEGETLPEDIVIDVLSKYSFLDPTDIQKWIKKLNVEALISKQQKKLEGGDENDSDSGDDSGFGDLDFGDSGSSSSSDSDSGGSESSSDTSDITSSGDFGESFIRSEKRFREAYKRSNDTKRKVLREQRLQEVKRYKELNKRYRESREDIYFQVLQENGINDFKNSEREEHTIYVPCIDKNNKLYESFALLDKNKKTGSARMREIIDKDNREADNKISNLTKMVEQIKKDSTTSSDDSIRKMIEDYVKVKVEDNN